MPTKPRIAVVAVTLLAALSAGCSQDSDKLVPEYRLTAAPAALTVDMDDEAKTPITLTSSFDYDKRAERVAKLTFASSDANVAVMGKVADKKGFTDFEVEGKRWKWTASTKDVATIVVDCKKAGKATLEFRSEVEVTDYFPAKAEQTIGEVARVDVTCTKKVASSGCDDAPMVASLSEQLFGDAAALCSTIRDDVSSDPTVHSADEVAAAPGAADHTETRLVAAASGAATTEAGSLLACGPHALGETVCPVGAEPLDGDLLVVANVLNAPLPNESESYLHYGFAFDANGDPTDDYTPSPSYPNDWYQGTDRAYELHFLPGWGFDMGARLADNSFQTPLATNARIVIADDVLALVMSADEVDVEAGGFRVTAMSENGDWGFSSPWTGDVEPPVADGLFALTY